MARLTLDDILNEPDEFGLLDVKSSAVLRSSDDDKRASILLEVDAFKQKHGRAPNPDALDHEEMRLGTIWEKLGRPEATSSEEVVSAPALHWRDDTLERDAPASLDDLFADDEFDVDASIYALNHVTPSAQRLQPDHRADIVPCKDFELFAPRFDEIAAALEEGTRKAAPVKKWESIEPIEGDVFIRNGLYALIAEKSEMSRRGGARDHRLRVIYSNGTESDPLMSSFRKSLGDDATARTVSRVGLGPLDPDWDNDRLELSGTIYVARSLSDDPAIQSRRMIMHKIGVTSQSVKRRVADARNDPTFLMAPVEVVAVYELKNMARHKVESLLHSFFHDARASDVFVKDRFGKAIYPKEWFYVLPDYVAQAAELLREKRLYLYRYDVAQQKIVRV